MDAAERDLSRATLDTLPINVAVLNNDGEILFTNRAWRAFGGQDPTRPPPEEVGVNYLDAIDPETDEHAAAALDGLVAVLEGDQESFTLEYPCHSPDERRWFLMRVTRFERDASTRLVVAHSDITERKLAELEAERRAEEVRRERQHLEHLVARINGLLEDITHGLVGATSRREVDRLLCSRLVETDPYRIAWVAERDLAADRLVVRDSAGSTEAVPDGVDLDTSDDPAVTAVAAGEPVIVDPLEPPAPGWLGRAIEAGAQAVAAFPLAVRDVSYGALVVCADRAGAFDERELAVLSALSRAAASTINAIEGRRILATTAVIELEFSIADRSFPLRRLAEAAACSLSFEGAVHRDDGSLLLFVTAATDDGDGLLGAAADLDAFESATVLADHDGDVLLELAVTESVVLAVAEHGGLTTGLEVDGGEARLTLEIPHEADARAVYAMLTERYPDTSLVAYRERERPARTRRGVESAIDGRLTERQRTALQSAYHAGYFEWPRTVDGGALAAAMDVSRPTFHQHLRAAERKVFSELYGQST